MKQCVVKRGLLCIVLVTALGLSAAAADFGLVLNGSGNYASLTGMDSFGFNGSLGPWFSASPGAKTSLYFSGKVTFQYENNAGTWTWPPVFEIERTELNYRPAQTVYLTLGRQRYRDSGGMIASGLFDGFSGSFGLGRVLLTGGVFYTGFIYKKTAEILMTADDRDKYEKPLDYGDLFNTYFASRRILVPLGVEFPDLTSRLSLGLTFFTQIDINDAPGLHTQYLETLFGIEALDTLRFTLTGVGGMAEPDEGVDAKFNLAAAAGAEWDLPGPLTDMFSAEVRWGSGAVNDTVRPFMPVSGIVQGTVFTPTLPGLMNAGASYTARPHSTFSFSAGTAAFWRTDLETFKERELDGASGDKFLGWEAYGQVIWSPQSALRLNAGGGAFFPGGAFIEDAGIRWKLNAGLIISL